MKVCTAKIGVVLVGRLLGVVGANLVIRFPSVPGALIFFVMRMKVF